MKTLRHFLFTAAILVLLSACQQEPDIPDAAIPEPPINTVDQSEVEVVPSAARIHVIAQSCAACHGTAGALQTLIPAIAGTPARILEMQLLTYRADAMPGATVMPRLAKGYTEAELRALAEYFANIDRLAEREATAP